MKINISFFNRDLVQLNDDSRSAVFSINWEHNGIYYPDRVWPDFGVVVLGFWIGTIIELLEGNQELTFTFMDGPYYLKAEYDAKIGMVKLSPKGMNTIWNVPLTVLIQEIKQAVCKTNEELKKRNIRKKDRSGLEKGNLILQKCLLKAENKFL